MAVTSIRSIQLPTAHELLQSPLIRDAKETIGLESIFDLYWKHKMNTDKARDHSTGLPLSQDEQ